MTRRPSSLLALFQLFALRPAAPDEPPRRRAPEGNPGDFYCGTSWPDAFASCPLPCASGEDEECASLGGGYGCFGYTGCRDRVGGEGAGGEGASGEWASDEGASGSDEGTEAAVEANEYCGASWLDATFSCSAPCGASPCPAGQTCYQATNCHVPPVRLRSSLLVTMLGPDRVMEGADGEVFGGTVGDVVGEEAGEAGIRLGGVELEGQSVAFGRRLRRADGSWDAEWEASNVTRRRLPSGSSALDVSVVITGDYRPPPYLDLDSIAEDSINRGGERVVSTLKERGSRAGSSFFERVTAVQAVKREAATQRPTRAPSAEPTPGPTGPPTPFPSAEPSSPPSDMPSGEPTRTVYNAIMTGSQDDLLLGGSTTSSYGYLFNVRTKPASGVVLVTAFDFYTHATSSVRLSLYSRIGSFKDHKGSTDGWDLIARGPVVGRGIGRYTSVPEEMFEPVDIPGGGETRAFYLTLDTIDLVYKTGEGTESDAAIQTETEDVEIWEGEGVLANPLPDPNDPMNHVFFRYPRNFLGTIYYDRLPCKPFGAYGRIDRLPCPDLPTASPTEPRPTGSPTRPPPTANPATAAPATPAPDGSTPAPVDPTESPSLPPTLSGPPSAEPSSSYPTASPAVPMRANILVNLRSVPERPMTEREYEKFLELMVKFLQRHTEKSMAIESIDIWHQNQVFVDASTNNTSNTTETSNSPEKKTRDLLEQEKLDQILAFKKKQKEQSVPQTTATQVTLILRISFSFLPQDLLAKMAVVTIQENEMELIEMLQEQSAFYTYFKPLDGVTADVVVELTPPPTMAPTTYPFYLASQVEEVVLEKEDGGFGFGVMVGVGVGFLWCCLTGCSVVYLMKARTTMKEQRDLENLLKQVSSGPMAEETASSSNNSSEIPMGNDDDKSLSTEAELSILEKKKAAAGLANSQRHIPKLDVRKECIETQLPRNSSSNNLRNSSKDVVDEYDRLPRNSSSSNLRNSSKSMRSLVKSSRRELSSSLRQSSTSRDSGKSVTSKWRTSTHSKSAQITTAPRDDCLTLIRQVHSTNDLGSVRSSSNRGKVRSSTRRSPSDRVKVRASTKSSTRKSSTSAKRNASI